MSVRPLPAPRTEGSTSVEQAIANRRSVRSFGPERLSIVEIGQLLWSTQGITDPQRKLRAAPSAMEAYPLELYVATADGLERYRPGSHGLKTVLTHDPRPDLRAAAHDQESVTSAPAVFVFTAVYARTSEKLGPGSEPYVHMDLGHAAQNLLLQAQALGLAGVPIAWLDPVAARESLGLPEQEQPLYLVPVGRPEA